MNVTNCEAIGWKGEEVADAIRKHETETREWAFQPAAERLTRLYDQMNSYFFSGSLPKAIIAIGPDLITRYGYYRLGRDEIGAKHRIHLNARHFGRSESSVGVTLLHEMIHLFQHEFGHVGHRPRYHNKEFIDLAAVRGIESQIGNGATLSVSQRLRQVLEEYGFSHERPMIADTDDRPISKPLRKVAWHCGCGQEAWVERGQDLHAVCAACLRPFRRLELRAETSLSQQESEKSPTESEGLYIGMLHLFSQSDVTFQKSITPEAPTLATHNNTA